MARLMVDDSPSFRIRRSTTSPNGFVSDVDPGVKAHLVELNGLLKKRVLPSADPRAAAVGAAAAGGAIAIAAPGRGKARGRGKGKVDAQAAVVKMLRLNLAAKKTPKPSGAKSSWQAKSLADFLFTTKENPKGRLCNLSEHIDQTATLSQLKYNFLDEIKEKWATVDYNARTVLEDYPYITDYLIAYAYYIKNVRDVAALKHFIVDNPSGTQCIADYAAISATRELIDREQLKVADYNDDDGTFVENLNDPPILLSVGSFGKAVRAKIQEFVFDTDEELIIDQAKLGTLPPGIKPILVKYIQQSPIPINKDNARLYLPHIVMQIMRMKGPTAAAIDPAPADDDFRVQFQDDSSVAVEINKSAVRCAAQLYHTMVLGDELDVFGAVNYLTNRRLFRNGGIRIESRQLRNDIQSYVLSNEFIDLKNGQRNERTRPAERQMFHRLVFDQGDAKVPDDLYTNEEFKQLWKVLMLESARYLERAQASVNPESFVSRQNVMQAVEDLQYNLSSRCTGMATMMGPIADAELNFVLERILKHPEIIQQIVPEGGTWKQAIDKLNAEQRKRPGTAATLYNKARLGQGIIDAIADYTAEAFEDDGIFGDFISKVDAFIITQSILQRPKFPMLKEEHEEAEHDGDAETSDMPPHMAPYMAPNMGPVEAANGAQHPDEWDF